MNTTNVLKKPIISEKSLKSAENNWYTFKVATNANKKQIAKTVENEFKVNVLAIKTAIFKGKTKKVGRKRIEIKGESWKKAIVRIKEGQKIGIFEEKGA